MNKKVLVSTDIGSDIDDALSLLSMFNTNINIGGIITVNGEVDFRSYIAKHMVNLSGRNIPVIKGDSEPLDKSQKPYSYFEEWNVDDSFVVREEGMSDEISFKPLEEVGILKGGIEDLVKELKKGSRVIFSLAPLTSIARLIEEHPEVVKNIEHLYVMGCRFGDPSIGEHNIRYDFIAAKKVFESCVPITVVPGDLCSKYRMPISQIELMRGPVGEYVKEMSKGFVAVVTATNFELRRFKEIFSDNELEEILASEELWRPEVEAALVTGVKSYLPNASLSNFCETLVKINFMREVSPEELNRLIRLKDKLVGELGDPYYGAYHGRRYFSTFNQLQNLLDGNDEVNWSFSELAIRTMKRLMPKDISISDVYVPYCFLYPERLVVEKKEVVCTPNGYCELKKGNKHQVVEDLDFEHFKYFVEENIK